MGLVTFLDRRKKKEERRKKEEERRKKKKKKEEKRTKSNGVGYIPRQTAGYPAPSLSNPK